MAIDYNQRKAPVGKNKPRKQPGKSLAGILLGMAAAGYVAGVVSGWFFFHAPPSPITINQAQSPAPPSTQGPQPTGGEGAAASAPPPLTFYNTLPKGSSAVMGSGLNLAPTRPVTAPSPGAEPVPADAQAQTAEPAPKALPPSPAPPAKAQAPAPPVSALKATPPAATAPKVPASPPQPKPTAESRIATYTVQAASCQTRAEADQVRARLAKAGMSPFIVEASVPGKGTWYRVRVGKGLSQAEAMSMAAKAGSGAEVVPERAKAP